MEFEGITFAAQPGVLYLPAREVALGLGWSLRWNRRTERLALDDESVPNEHTRWLPNDTLLVALRSLRERSARVGWRSDRLITRVERGGRVVWVRQGEKRVAINRATQLLRAWQGRRLVLETRVSTGRPGHSTPTGTFRAGPYRARMHYSRLYDNAPMPWSVQVHGHVFIHGYHSVPPRAASHGCIRLPLTGNNPARWFYEWIDDGTAIVITDGWPAGW